ncbi:uncharacterized protein EDB91DRAFT_1080365 [Suillus paluster]|uniref:uncharacterized protein n=1 Tax=Suillus paluster TaxID=48578 RepID=UPI001B8725BB|nr:uncharacterized protein EDB91DRAFT_1080365 [Suillus paluster]KAG1745456.1 hypothetical protein EDB91DRAFT_1080365 [Suillus paluster]
MAPPASPRHTRPKNATQHPGLVLLEGQKKQCTKAQITQDKECALEAQAIKEAAVQCGVNWLAGIEAAMEVQQATEAANRAKPVKPWARPVKKKESVKESMQGVTSELTSENHPVQAVVQDAGGHRTANSTGVGAGNGKAIVNKEFENEGRKMKKKKKANPTISHEVVSAATRQIQQVRVPDSDKKGNVNPSVICLLTIMLLMLTESTLRFMNLTWGLRNKKYGLLGKVHNWRAHLEPELKGAAKPSPVPSVPTETVSANSLGISSARTGQTVATTVSLAKDPPPSLTDSSRTSHIPASDKDEDINIDIDVDADDDEDDEEFEEHLSSLIANGKGRGGCSSTKRPIKAVDLISSSKEDLDAADDSMILDTSEFMTPEVEPIPTELAWITSKTSVIVCENPNPPKKAKLEPVSQITSILASPEPNLMSTDLMMKPKSGNQWRNTNLPQIMLRMACGKGAQPNFWSIDTNKLLPALQAIFDVAYPGMNHNVQPKGPIIGLCICSWRSNFGSTAMALIANFLATSKDDKNEDEDNNIDFEQTLAANLLDEWAFLYNNPDVCDPDQIYWSEFMLEMIESAHMNAIAGFLDVPALNTDDLQLKERVASTEHLRSFLESEISLFITAARIISLVIAACTASLEHALNFVAKPKASGNDQSIGTSSAKGSTTKGHRILPLKCNKSSGKDSTAALAFSEANCGLATAEYYQSLKRWGTNYMMDTISLVCQHQEAIQKLKNAPAEADPSVVFHVEPWPWMCQKAVESWPASHWPDITMKKVASLMATGCRIQPAGNQGWPVIGFRIAYQPA